MGMQRVAGKADNPREPYVIDLQIELCSDKLGDLVFKALLFFVRKGEIIGVSANLETAPIHELSGLRGNRSAGQQKRADQRCELPLESRVRNRTHLVID